jgi:tetratricopeptide (TPR) repeat protein
MSILTKQRIDETVLAADKLSINSWFSFSWIKQKLTGQDSDQKKAFTLYQQSYNDYLSIAEYEYAGDVSLKLADLSKTFGSGTESYDYYQKCIDCYRKARKSEKLVTVCNIVAGILERNNGIDRSKHLTELGKIYEEENRYDESIKLYLRASEICGNDNNIDLLCKVADMYIIYKNDVEKSRDIYTKILSRLGNDNIGNVLSIDYTFMLLLLELNMHAKKGSHIPDKLLHDKTDNYPMFKDSYEYHLLNNCINAYNNGDVNEFVKNVKFYDSIYKLNHAKMKLLNEIRQVTENKKYIGTAIY